MALLLEPTELPDFAMRIGFVFIQGTGFRVGTETGDGYQRHMSVAAARRLARTLGETDQSGELEAVIEALNAHADRLEGWLDGKGADLPKVIHDMQPLGSA